MFVPGPTTLAWLAVATGGAVGATARMAVQLAWDRAATASTWWGHTLAGFPGGTMVVNVVGCFLLAWWTASMGTQPGGGTIRAFVATGVLGAFTTFSTFGVDGWRLMLEGRPLSAAVYLSGTLLACAVAVAGGWALGVAARS